MTESNVTDIVTTAEHENPLANLPEELQKKILAASQQIQQSSSVTINKIRLDAKNYILPDSTETEKFSGIIVGIKHANIHYAGEYEEGVTNPPDCIALGDVPCNDLVPHESVVEKYCTTCAACPKFQWGSAARGKGKSCGEHTLLAVYIPSLGDELYLLEEKKANSKAVDGYLASINNKYGHPVAVLTEFAIGVKNKWEQSFSATGRTSAELVTKLVDRFEEANVMLEARVLDAYKRSQTAADSSTTVEATTTDEPVRKARSR